jgi:hypothetical protein
MQWHNPKNSKQFPNYCRRVYCFRDAPKNFLIISPSGPIIRFHMFGELKALGTNRSRTLGSVIIEPRGIHKNYVINSYSHIVGSYILAQRRNTWLQHESITSRMRRVCNKLKSRLLFCLRYVRHIFNQDKWDYFGAKGLSSWHDEQEHNLF